MTISRSLPQATRRYLRFRRSRPVAVRAPGHDHCAYQRLVLVGRGGAELRSRAPIEAGALVDLEICLAGGVIKTRGRVTGCREELGDHLVGVEFFALSAEDERLLGALIADRD